MYDNLANRRNTLIGTAIHMETQAELSAFGPVVIQEPVAKVYTLPKRSEVAPAEPARMASITHLPLRNEVTTPTEPVIPEQPSEIGEQERLRLEALRMVAEAHGLGRTA